MTSDTLSGIVMSRKPNRAAPDRRRAGRAAVERLGARGRRRLGLAIMTRTRPGHRNRLAGHCEALAIAGLDSTRLLVFDASPHRDPYAVHDPETRQWDYPVDIVERCVDELVRDGGVDAIVAHDDFFAATLLRVLRRRCIRAPDDVAVVGYLNHYLADWVDPPLTTIDTDQSAAAGVMVKLAEKLVDGAAAGGEAGIQIPPRLIVRGSTRGSSAPRPQAARPRPAVKRVVVREVQVAMSRVHGSCPRNCVRKRIGVRETWSPTGMAKAGIP